MRYKIRNEFDVTPERFWAVFFDETYNIALYNKLQITRRVMKQETRPDGTLCCIQRLTPQQPSSPLIQSLVKGNIHYTETLTLKPGCESARVITIPNFLADKVTAKGFFSIRPTREGKTLRTWSAVFNCSVLFFGRRIETNIVNQIRRSYQTTAIFTKNWLSRLNERCPDQ